jgi:putative addiction module CopG family antidote
MAKKSEKRTTALSISLPDELARAVSRRVESGLYASASEVIREALRLLLETDRLETGRLETGRQETGAKSAQGEWRQNLAGQNPAGHNPTGQRLATAFELAELGAAMRRTRLDPHNCAVAESTPDLRPQLPATDQPVLEDEDNQLAPGLRLAPERLKKLKLDA